MTAPELLSQRYRLIERIGAGAVAEVWRAIDTALQREVAVKTIDVRAQHEDPEVPARFKREAVATAGLSHPNIVTVFDTGIDGDLAFIVMELLTGPTLRTMLREQTRLDYDQGIDLMRQVAQGLAAAHVVGVVHRDIKPNNVMLHLGEPKIVDFGIASLEQDANEHLTAPATAIGTPAYISPEQALGHPVTPASDMYSFGCLMMAVFAGRPPFQAEQAVALARAHVSDAPPLLRELRPDCPPALDELVAHLLAKDPAQRPGAEFVSRELERIAADPGVSSSLPDLDEANATMTMAIAGVAAPSTIAAAQITAGVPWNEIRAEGPRRRSAMPWVAAGAVLIAALLAWQTLSNRDSPSPVIITPRVTVTEQRTVTPPQPTPSQSIATTRTTRAPQPTRGNTTTQATQAQTTSSATTTITVTQTATATTAPPSATVPSEPATTTMTPQPPTPSVSLPPQTPLARARILPRPSQGEN